MSDQPQIKVLKKRIVFVFTFMFLLSFLEKITTNLVAIKIEF